MKFFIFPLFFLYVSSFANENIQYLQNIDTTIISDSTISTLPSNSPIITAPDTTTVQKIYRKKIVQPTPIDTLIKEDTLIKNNLLAIDTILSLSKFTLHHFIPFYIVPNDSIHDKIRYEGERRIYNNNYNNMYMYVYIFLFFLALCINILEAVNGNSYNQHKTLQSNKRKFSELNIYFLLIILVLEVLLSIGLALFLNLIYIQIFGNQTQNFLDLIHTIMPVSIACFIFLTGKHIITYIIQNIFLSRKDHCIVLYFYKTMLIYLTSLLYMTTCITFFIDSYYKIYIIQIATGIGILIYIYALFKVLKNLSKPFLKTLLGAFIYIITLQVIPYLLFFKFLYIYYFLTQ
ncbi:MAG: hypothetical protein ACRC0A_00260 [Chitinophagaceae bacterium]